MRTAIAGALAEWSAVFATSPEPVAGYVLAMTPRSGSTWLARMLTATGRLGRVEEWFLPGHPLVGLAHPRSLDEYVEAVKRAATGPNGVWGVKGDLPQLADVLPDLPGPVVYLTRQDRVAQAISLYRAVVSGRWQEPVPPGEVPFDAEAIEQWAGHLARMESAWEEALESRSVLRITYEALCADPRGTVLRIARFVGVELLDAPDPAAHGHSLSGAESRSWRSSLGALA